MHETKYAMKHMEGLGILYYTILQERTAEGRLSYGIEVLLLTPRGEESCTIRDITSSRRKMERIAALLYRNNVTPCTLREVLEDLL